MDFLKYIAKRSHLGTLALASLLLMTSGFVFSYMGEINKLSILKEGVQTCFGRVKNSYTAKLLGEGKSLYVDQAFMNTTEDCFGETLAALNADFDKVLGQTEKKLNTISSDTHWFHQKLGSEDAKLVGGSVTVSTYGARFDSIESNFSQVIQDLERYHQDVKNKLSTGKYLFVSFILLSMVLMVWESYRRIVVMKRRELIEKRALDELTEKGGRTSSAVESIVSEALAEGHFNKTADLFLNFHGQFDVSNKNAGEQKTVTFVTGEDKRSWEDQIEKVWKEADEVEENRSTETNDEMRTARLEDVRDIQLDKNNVHIDHVLSRVVNIMSGSLFTKGIILDFDLGDDTYVVADEEAVEQVFYHLLTRSLKGLEEKTGEKKITIGLKQLGGSVLVEMESNGTGFSNEFIRYEAGLGSLNDAAESSATELEICKIFMADFGGKVIFENVTSDDGAITGSRIKLLFVGSKDRKTGLVELKKGTKKEILEQLNQKVTPHQS